MAPKSSGGTRIVWHQDEITPRLRALGPKLDRGVAAVMAHQAPQIQNYMRDNASWTDRTGNARQGLFAQPFKTGALAGSSPRGLTSKGSATHGIVLYHSVPYGLWLEVRFSGRYAIILPTVEAKAPDVMRMINKLLRSL